MKTVWNIIHWLCFKLFSLLSCRIRFKVQWSLPILPSYLCNIQPFSLCDLSVKCKGVAARHWICLYWYLALPFDRWHLKVLSTAFLCWLMWLMHGTDVSFLNQQKSYNIITGGKDNNIPKLPRYLSWFLMLNSNMYRSYSLAESPRS